MERPPDPPRDPAERMTGDEFVAAWQGVPFAWDGRDFAGIDCWGLVVRFYADVLGLDLPDWQRGAHGRSWISQTFAREAKSHFLQLANPRDGCIALAFKAHAPHHAGIVWRGSVLHADQLRGVIWERVTDFVTLNPGTVFGNYRP